MLFFVDVVNVVAVNDCLVVHVIEEHVLVCPANEDILTNTEAEERRVVLQVLLHSPAEPSRR